MDSQPGRQSVYIMDFHFPLHLPSPPSFASLSLQACHSPPCHPLHTWIPRTVDRRSPSSRGIRYELRIPPPRPSSSSQLMFKVCHHEIQRDLSHSVDTSNGEEMASEMYIRRLQWYFRGCLLEAQQRAVE